MNTNDPVEFLRLLAEGMIRNPFQIFLFFFILLLFVIILIIINLLVRKYDARMSEIVHSSAYQRYLQLYDLSSREIFIIEMLSPYLKDSKKKYLLLNNQKTFTACLYMYNKSHKNKLTPDLLKPLFSKLGFDLNQIPVIINSSKDLLPESPLVLIDEKNKTVSGKVTRIMENSIMMTVDKPDSLNEIEGDVKLFTNNFTGLIEMKSHIQKREGDKLLLAHADTIKRNKPQSFTKKKWDIPVLVKREGFLGREYKSKIISLNSKSVILLNPEEKFRPGDDLILTLTRGANPLFHLFGEVTKASRNRKVLVMEFGHLDADEKERIKAIISKGYLN